MTALVFHIPTSDTIIQFSGVLIALGIVYRYLAKPIVSAAKDLAESAEAHKKYGKTLADIATQFEANKGHTLKDTIDALSAAAAAAKSTAEAVAQSAEIHEAMHKEFVDFVHERFHQIDNALTPIQLAAHLRIAEYEKKATSVKRKKPAKKSARRKA